MHIRGQEERERLIEEWKDKMAEKAVNKANLKKESIASGSRNPAAEMDSAASGSAKRGEASQVLREEVELLKETHRERPRAQSGTLGTKSNRSESEPKPEVTVKREAKSETMRAEEAKSEAKSEITVKRDTVAKEAKSEANDQKEKVGKRSRDGLSCKKRGGISIGYARGEKRGGM